MPLPKPRENETEKEFISRCMGDSEMNKEFPGNAQRFAVCKSLFKKSKQDNSEKEKSTDERNT